MSRFMRMLSIVLLLFLSAACGRDSNAPKLVTCAPYFFPLAGYCGNELMTVMDNRLVTFDEENGAFSFRCEKEGCTHEYKQSGENTCQAALPIATATGFYEGNIYLAYTPEDGRMNSFLISEYNPDTKEQKEINSFVDQVDVLRGVFYKNYYYYISDSIQREVPQFKLRLNRIALESDATPQILWGVEDSVNFPGIRGYQLCDNLLLMDILTSDGQMLTVYDLDSGAVIIDQSKALAGAYCHNNRLYYINEGQQCAEVYDIKTGAYGEPIPFACEKITDLALAGDEQYFYISETLRDTGNGKDYSNIYVYDYEGKHVNTITIRDEAEDQRVTYLFSTSSHIFIGSLDHF